jgi:hypothetical protein
MVRIRTARGRKPQLSSPEVSNLMHDRGRALSAAKRSSRCPIRTHLAHLLLSADTRSVRWMNCYIGVCLVDWVCLIRSKRQNRALPPAASPRSVEARPRRSSLKAARPIMMPYLCNKVPLSFNDVSFRLMKCFP